MEMLSDIRLLPSTEISSGIGALQHGIIAEIAPRDPSYARQLAATVDGYKEPQTTPPRGDLPPMKTRKETSTTAMRNSRPTGSVGKIQKGESDGDPLVEVGGHASQTKQEIIDSLRQGGIVIRSNGRPYVVPPATTQTAKETSQAAVPDASNGRPYVAPPATTPETQTAVKTSLSSVPDARTDEIRRYIAGSWSQTIMFNESPFTAPRRPPPKILRFETNGIVTALYSDDSGFATNIVSRYFAEYNGMPSNHQFSVSIPPSRFAPYPVFLYVDLADKAANEKAVAGQLRGNLGDGRPLRYVPVE